MSIHLDYSNIFEFTQVPIEYLFVDSADIEPGVSGIAVSNLSMQDWFFRFHFPNDPIMPGTLMMEAVMELGTLVIGTLPEKAKKRIMVRGCKNMTITGQARPGDQLKITTETQKYRRGVAAFSGQIENKGAIILKMQYELMVPDEMTPMPCGGGLNKS